MVISSAKINNIYSHLIKSNYIKLKYNFYIYYYKCIKKQTFYILILYNNSFLSSYTVFMVNKKSILRFFIVQLQQSKCVNIEIFAKGNSNEILHYLIPNIYFTKKVQNVTFNIINGYPLHCIKTIQRAEQKLNNIGEKVKVIVNHLHSTIKDKNNITNYNIFQMLGSLNNNYEFNNYLKFNNKYFIIKGIIVLKKQSKSIFYQIFYYLFGIFIVNLCHKLIDRILFFNNKYSEIKVKNINIFMVIYFLFSNI